MTVNAIGKRQLIDVIEVIFFIIYHWCFVLLIVKFILKDKVLTVRSRYIISAIVSTHHSVTITIIIITHYF